MARRHAANELMDLTMRVRDPLLPSAVLSFRARGGTNESWFSLTAMSGHNKYAFPRTTRNPNIMSLLLVDQLGLAGLITRPTGEDFRGAGLGCGV